MSQLDLVGRRVDVITASDGTRDARNAHVVSADSAGLRVQYTLPGGKRYDSFFPWGSVARVAILPDISVALGQAATGPHRVTVGDETCEIIRTEGGDLEPAPGTRADVFFGSDAAVDALRAALAERFER